MAAPETTVVELAVVGVAGLVVEVAALLLWLEPQPAASASREKARARTRRFRVDVSPAGTFLNLRSLRLGLFLLSDFAGAIGNTSPVSPGIREGAARTRTRSGR
jgi:hypothetical protein